MAQIAVLLTEGPWQTQKWETAANIAKAALEKGHKVKFFMFLDGVYNGIKYQNFPDFSKMPIDHYKELVKLGAEIICCGICVNARGLQDGKDYEKGFVVGGLPDFSEMIGDADRVVTL